MKNFLIVFVFALFFGCDQSKPQTDVYAIISRVRDNRHSTKATISIYTPSGDYIHSYSFKLYSPTNLKAGDTLWVRYTLKEQNHEN